MSDSTVTPADLRRGFLARLDGDFAAAETFYRRAMTDPRLAPEAAAYLIHLLEMQHRWEEALTESRAALAREPERAGLAVHLATSLFGLGHYAEAWPLYETRARLAAGSVRPQLPYPEWQGEPVGSVTVWDEQGFGDAIQFARYLPQLAARGMNLTLVVRPELAPLLEGLGAVVIPAQGQMRVPVADAWTMIGSLPGRLGVTLESLGPAPPYLNVAPERRAKWARGIDPSARIGVVGRGKPGHANDHNRSLPSEGAAFLQSLPGAMSLLPEDSKLPVEDFADTAAIVERLDLIITVDTAVAHLTGAMGKPCWLLLPYVGTDWRWLRDGRTDSPWYPSLRLYRQPKAGDWAGVLRQIAQDLPAFFSAKS